MMRAATQMIYRDIRVPGVRVGQVQDPVGKTGVSVILFDTPVPAGASICGRATSTRQADSLRDGHIVDRVDALCFTGGSAYGLDSTGGVLRFLEREGRGLPTRYGPVPVCPSAAIFDLGFGAFDVRPTQAMAMEACEVAESSRMTVGSVGAGCGATVGKIGGVECSMKGGVGTRTTRVGDLVVQVMTVCNGFGDVVDPESGEILAGAREKADSLDLLDTQRAITEGRLPGGFASPSPENTVLSVVLTNARLDRRACQVVAEQAVAGLKKAMQPALAPVDGDLIICAAMGLVLASPGEVGEMASDCLAGAIDCAIRNADGFGIVPSYSDRVQFLEDGETWEAEPG